MSREYLVILHGEPHCNVHIYSGGGGAELSEFHLTDDGLLHIGHHTFNHTQYCLEELYDTTGQINMRAKVCDQAASHHREMLKTCVYKHHPCPPHYLRSVSLPHICAACHCTRIQKTDVWSVGKSNNDHILQFPFQGG